MNFSRFEVVKVADESRWMEALERIGVYDFYHLPAYHRLAEKRGEGSGLLLVYEHNDVSVAMPVLLREGVVRLGPGVDVSVRDVTSVYGYAGPVSCGEVGENDLAAFGGALHDYLSAEQVVCAFSRLHPLLGTSRCLRRLGAVEDVGFTVSKDLTVPPAAQRSGMNRTFRRNVNRLERLGYVVEEAGEECLEDHVRVYRETMDRAHANEDYYYDLDYFRFLMREMSDQAHLFVCRLGNEVTSTVFGMLCRGFLQGHLGGTASVHMPWSPMKLVFYGMSSWGTSNGAHTLHLGGGVGSQRDSLYAFKKAFSEREHVYRVWKHVVAPGRYRELTEAVRKIGGQELAGYFPIYRHPGLRASSPASAQVPGADRPPHP